VSPGSGRPDPGRGAPAEVETRSQVMVSPDTSSGGAPAPTDTAAPSTTSAATAAAPAIPATAKPPTPAWAEWLTTTASSFYSWLMRPRVRLTVTGALLLLVGGLIATNTVWTLPLVIIGALMVAVAWLGRRLEGRFAVEWGETGTQLVFKATIKAPQPTTETPALAATSPVAPTHTAPAALANASDDVIEGEAHTVEINVAELKALIAAAEAADVAEAADAAEAAEASAAPVRDIRIRRLADEADRSPRPAG
jgi:hypothetical protein